MLTITSYKFGDLPEAYAVQSEGRDIARFDKLADAELFVEAKKVDEMIRLGPTWDEFFANGGKIKLGNPQELLAKPEGSVEIDASKLPISEFIGDKIHAPISEILAKRYILPDSYMKELVEDVKPDVFVTKE